MPFWRSRDDGSDSASTTSRGSASLKPAGPPPPGEHSCTDCACLFLFALAMSAHALVGGAAFALGDPSAVFYGTDHSGRRCGSHRLEHLPFTFFPHLSQDLAARGAATPFSHRLYGVCVASCPARGDVVLEAGSENATGSDNATGLVRWTAALGTVPVLHRCLPVAEEHRSVLVACEQPSCSEVGESCLEVAGYEDRGLWAQDTAARRMRCERALTITHSEVASLPDGEAFAAQLTRGLGATSRALDSVVAARGEVITCGLVLPVLLGLLWLVFLRLAARCTVHLLLCGVGLSLLAAAAMCALKGGLVPADVAEGLVYTDEHGQAMSGAERDVGFQWAAATLFLLFAVYAAAYAALCRRISITVGVVKGATAVISESPQLLLFSFVMLLVSLATLLYSVVVPIFLLTARPTPAEVGLVANGWLADGSSEVGDTVAALLSPLPPDRLRTFLLVYHVAASFWAAQFVGAFGWTATSGAVSHWFFFRGTRERQRWPLTASLWRALRFHAGSIAYGAFLLAVTQLLRRGLQWLERQSAGGGTGVTMRCLRCYTRCLGRCISYINSFAYIFVALDGDAFCSACRETFLLTARYPAQAVINVTVQSLLFGVQSVGIPLACGAVSYALISSGVWPTWVDAAGRWLEGAASGSPLTGPAADGAGVAQLAEGGGGWLSAQPLLRWMQDQPGVEPLLPSLAVAALALFVGRALASVYECTVSTIFVCAMRDAEAYGGAHVTSALRASLKLEGKGGTRSSAALARAKSANSRGLVVRGKGAAEADVEAAAGRGYLRLWE